MSDRVKQVVRKAYAEIAVSQRASGDDCCDVSCCVSGYSAEELALLPAGADLGLGCGNPLGAAAARPGDVVLDLGSGAGIDCFLAFQQVGPEGHVIGVDMTPQMLERARRNAEAGGYRNVEFRLGEIEALPVADASVDLVISNCVINLVPDQARVFAEAFRVLRPGGKLVVSDTLTTVSLPESLLNSEAAKVACISPSATKESYFANLHGAGFRESAIVNESPIPASLAFEESLAKGLTTDLDVPNEVLRQAAASMVGITVQAVKPAE